MAHAQVQPGGGAPPPVPPPFPPAGMHPGMMQEFPHIAKKGKCMSFKISSTAAVFALCFVGYDPIFHVS